MESYSAIYTTDKPPLELQELLTDLHMQVKVLK